MFIKNAYWRYKRHFNTSSLRFAKRGRDGVLISVSWHKSKWRDVKSFILNFHVIIELKKYDKKMGV